MIAFIVASAVSVLFLAAAEISASEKSDVIAGRVADGLYFEIVYGSRADVDSMLERLAQGRAAAFSPDGTLIAGTVSDDVLASGRRYPIASGGSVVGELVMLRTIPGTLALPLPLVIGVILLISVVAYLVTNFFGQLVAQQTAQIAGLVSQATLKQSLPEDDRPILFTEFRSLRAALLRQIQSLHRENDRLMSAAYKDERTGLGNVAELTRQLTQFISRSSFEFPSAYIQIDIEPMHHNGDQDTAFALELQTAISRRISGLLKDQLTAYSMPDDRWPAFALASDDFGVLVDQIGSRNEINKFAKLLITRLKEPYAIGGKKVTFAAFAGIAMIPEDGQTPQDIRKRAYTALVQARRKEGADLQFYSPKLDRQSAARKRLESEVRTAVEQNAFTPVFQPKVDLATGKIVGAEALARWQLESGRIVSPGVFIPVAESCGLICEIGEQITRKACMGAAKWADLGYRDISVAVNVSPRQFENDDLGTMLIDSMTTAGLLPRLLQLEITESVAVTDPERLRDVVAPLKSMGVRLAIDDFGTGHSNLAMLGRLPFDVFKIDRQFICNLHTDKQAPAIVEMILGMAEALGMETVAEGVETEDQQQFLRRRGCDQYQGYFFSPPVSLDKFIEMVRRNRQPAAA
ncbi:putative bifunctional diguanylate cyclase/phosphodiesterase [Henriciella marina]|uniref:putative bifunctional diguanylate cyclase/phosphodiesterase n=1 Tax=Henriciella marina TaxID=453851 RepID=UPI0014616A68|nr:GGDEF domain-containing phosphodiesterase [Henriciella marina]